MRVLIVTEQDLPLQYAEVFSLLEEVFQEM
jgi:hypothetical protein